MKPFLLFVLFFLMAQQSNAGRVYKVKGSKALVKASSGEFDAGDDVDFIDKYTDKVATGEVYKVKGRKVYVKIKSGKTARGHKVVSEGAADVTDDGDDIQAKGLVAYGGFYSSDATDTVMTFGGDYRFQLNPKKPYAFRVGLTYWSSSTDFFDLSLINLSGGGEYIFKAEKFSFYGGARIGYASISAEAKTIFGNAQASESSLHLTPYGGLDYGIATKMYIGAEVRAPYYFSGEGSFFGDFYLLATFRYRLF